MQVRAEEIDAANVVVYGRPGCKPCKMMSEFLDGEGIEHLKVCLSANPRVTQEKGIRSVPECHVRTSTGTRRIVGYGVAEENELLHALASERLGTVSATVTGGIPLS